jgi:hypothetical protein
MVDNERKAARCWSRDPASQRLALESFQRL